MKLLYLNFNLILRSQKTELWVMFLRNFMFKTIYFTAFPLLKCTLTWFIFFCICFSTYNSSIHHYLNPYSFSGVKFLNGEMHKLWVCHYMTNVYTCVMQTSFKRYNIITPRKFPRVPAQGILSIISPETITFMTFSTIV